MTTGQTYGILIFNGSSSTGDEAVSRLVAMEYASPELLLVVRSQVDALRKPSREDEQVSRAERAIEVVASVSFQIGLLYQRNPHLAFVAKGTDWSAVVIDRNVVIHLDGSPAAIQVQLDDVLAFRIVDRVCILILRKDVVRDEFVLVAELEFVMSRDSKRTQNRAVSDSFLLHFIASDLGGHIRHSIHIVLAIEDIYESSPVLQLSCLLDRERQHSIWIDELSLRVDVGDTGSRRPELIADVAADGACFYDGLLVLCKPRQVLLLHIVLERVAFDLLSN